LPVSIASATIPALAGIRQRQFNHSSAPDYVCERTVSTLKLFRLKQFTWKKIPNYRNVFITANSFYEKYFLQSIAKTKISFIFAALILFYKPQCSY